MDKTCYYKCRQCHEIIFKHCDFESADKEVLDCPYCDELCYFDEQLTQKNNEKKEEIEKQKDNNIENRPVLQSVDIEDTKSQGSRVNIKTPRFVIDKSKNDEENKEKYIEEATKIINSGDALSFILDTTQKFHGGDLFKLEITYYSALTTKILNANGTHTNNIGEMGTGKSHVQRIIGNLLPPDRFIDSGLSPKALFYIEEYKDGIVIFIDDKLPSEDMATLIRQTTTKFHVKNRWTTVSKDRESLKLIAPARIVWWMNFIFVGKDAPLNDRFIPISFEETDSKKEEINDKIIEKNRKGLPDIYVDDDVEVCRSIFELLPECRIKIAFDKKKYYQIIDKPSPRDLNIISDLIKCSALLNYKKRLSYTELDILTVDVSEEDFDRIKLLWNDLFKKSGNKRDNLTDGQRKLYDLLLTGRYTQGEIAKKLGTKQPSVSAALKGLMEQCTDIGVEKMTITEKFGKDTSKSVPRKVYFIMKD